MSRITLPEPQSQLRFRKGLCWETSKPPKMRLLHKLGILLGVLTLLMSMTTGFLWYFHNIQKEKLQENHERLSSVEQSAFNYSGLLASCLNGETLFDKSKHIAFFTSKATEVDLTPIHH